MPQAAHAQAHPSSEITVTGVRSRLSNWRQAETSHVIVQSDGSEEELIRLTRNLERLHFLLTGLMGPSPIGEDTVKLRITLIGDVPEFEAMSPVSTSAGSRDHITTCSRSGAITIRVRTGW